MVTLLDGHSQSHYNSYRSLWEVHPSSTPYNSAFGQAFKVKTTGQTYKLTQTLFYLRKYGSPTGHLKACLYTMTGTYGTTAKPTGSPLASSELVDIASIPSNWTEIPFNFVGGQQYEVFKDQAYCIVILVNDGAVSASHHIEVKSSVSTQATHDGNACRFFESSWGYLDTEDACFMVYGEFVEPPPPPTRTLFINHDANGDTTPPFGTYYYDEPEYVWVTYIPDATFQFKKWVANGKDVSQNPIKVYMDKDWNLYGYGEEIPPPSGEGWIDPNSFEDPNSAWTNEPYAYDNNLNEWAITTRTTIGYTPFLILNTPYQIYGGKLRFYINSTNAPQTSVDIDVFRGGEWIHVYEARYPDWAKFAWIEKTFDAGIVTKMRIRFYLHTDYAVSFSVIEVDFYGREPLMPLLAKKLGSDLAVMLSGNYKGKVVMLV